LAVAVALPAGVLARYRPKTKRPRQSRTRRPIPMAMNLTGLDLNILLFLQIKN
jgi:hypothetical protein